MKNIKMGAASLAILGLIGTLSFSSFYSSTVSADLKTADLQTRAPGPLALRPLMIPNPPTISAKAHVLMDYNSGQILASHAAHEHLEPASLTKLMTMYVVNKELESGKLHLSDMIPISENAWRAEGSKMFIEVGKEVSVDDLVHGIIIQSGNDASIALAEHIAGSESAFADIMNAYAKALGMNDSHFMDATGMPQEGHYTSAYDLALLAQAIIREFPPELYAIHAQKWFLFNGIRQPNRNRLLWRNPSVDGLKTGSTDSAGYCLVASATKDNLRIISVVLGADSDANRAEQSNKLITYGLRFFETQPAYGANQPIQQARIFGSTQKTVPVGLQTPLFVTVPEGQYKRVIQSVELNTPLRAPVGRGQVVGKILFHLDDKLVAEHPLVALEDRSTGGAWSRFSDYVSMHLFSHGA